MHVRDWQTTPPYHAPHGEIVRELAGSSAGGTQQHSLAHITLPPGTASRLHYHPVAEECYFMLVGTGRVVLAGAEHQLAPGQMVAIAPGQVHQIFNESDTPISYLAICTPPWTPDCSVFLD